MASRQTSKHASSSSSPQRQLPQVQARHRSPQKAPTPMKGGKSLSIAREPDIWVDSMLARQQPGVIGEGGGKKAKLSMHVVHHSPQINVHIHARRQLDRVGQVRAVLTDGSIEQAKSIDSDGRHNAVHRRVDDRAFARALVQLEIGLLDTLPGASQKLMSHNLDNSVLAQLFFLQRCRDGNSKSFNRVLRGHIDSGIDEMKLSTSMACACMDRFCAAPALLPYRPALQLVRDALFGAIFVGGADSSDTQAFSSAGDALQLFSGRKTFAEAVLSGASQGASAATLDAFVKAWARHASEAERGKVMHRLVVRGMSEIMARKEGFTEGKCVEISGHRLHEMSRAIGKAITARSRALDNGEDSQNEQGNNMVLASMPLSSATKEILEKLPNQSHHLRNNALAGPEFGLSLQGLSMTEQVEFVAELLMSYGAPQSHVLGECHSASHAVNEYHAITRLRLESLRVASAGIEVMLGACHERRENMLHGILHALTASLSPSVIADAIDRARQSAALIEKRHLAISEGNASHVQQLEEQLGAHTMPLLTCLVEGARNCAEENDQLDTKLQTTKDDRPEVSKVAPTVQITQEQRKTLYALLSGLPDKDMRHMVAALAVMRNTNFSTCTDEQDERNRTALRHATGRHASIPSSFKISVPTPSQPMGRGASRRASVLQALTQLRDESGYKTLCDTPVAPPVTESKSGPHTATGEARPDASENARTSSPPASPSAIFGKALAAAEAVASKAAEGTGTQLNVDAAKICAIVRSLRRDNELQASLLETLLTNMASAQSGTNTLRDVLYDLVNDGTLGAEALIGIDKGRAEQDPSERVGRVIAEIMELLQSPTSEANGTQSLLLHEMVAGLTDSMMARLFDMSAASKSSAKKIATNMSSDARCIMLEALAGKEGWESVCGNMSDEARRQLLKTLVNNGSKDNMDEMCMLMDEDGRSNLMRALISYVSSSSSEWKTLVGNMDSSQRASMMEALASMEAEDHAVAAALSQASEAQQNRVQQLLAQAQRDVAALLGKPLKCDAETQVLTADISSARRASRPARRQSRSGSSNGLSKRRNSPAFGTILEDETSTDTQHTVNLPMKVQRCDSELTRRSNKKKRGSSLGMRGAGKGGKGTKDFNWTTNMCMSLFDQAIELNYVEGLETRFEQPDFETFDQFCLRYFLRQFGVASLARKKMKAFMKAVDVHQEHSPMLRALLTFIEAPTPATIRRLKFVLDALVTIRNEITRRPLFPPDERSSSSSWISLDRIYRLLPSFFKGRVHAHITSTSGDTNGNRGENAFERGLKVRLKQIAERGALPWWRLPRHKGYQLARTWRLHKNKLLEVLMGAATADESYQDDAMTSIFEQLDLGGLELDNDSPAKKETLANPAACSVLIDCISPSLGDKAERMLTKFFRKGRKTASAKVFCEMIRQAGAQMEISVFVEFMRAAGAIDAENKAALEDAPVTLEVLCGHLELPPSRVVQLCEDVGFPMNEEQIQMLDIDNNGMISWLEFTKAAASVIASYGAQLFEESDATATVADHDTQTPEALQEDEDADDMNMLALQLHPMFRSLSDDARTQVLKLMVTRTVEPNTVIMKQGEAGDDMFVLKRGTCTVHVSSKTTSNDCYGEEVATLTEPDFFGDVALTQANALRTATIISKTACELLGFSRGAFQELQDTCPSFKKSIEERNHAVKLVKEVPRFQKMPLKIVEEIMSVCTVESYRDGTRIIEQGDEADCMYFVKRGALNVEIDGVGQVSTLQLGQFFGERALFEEDQDVRTASVVASGDVELLVLHKDDFTVLLEDFPEFGQDVLLAKSYNYVDA